MADGDDGRGYGVIRDGSADLRWGVGVKIKRLFIEVPA